MLIWYKIGFGALAFLLSWKLHPGKQTSCRPRPWWDARVNAPHSEGAPITENSRKGGTFPASHLSHLLLSLGACFFWKYEPMQLLPLDFQGPHERWSVGGRGCGQRDVAVSQRLLFLPQLTLPWRPAKWCDFMMMSSEAGGQRPAAASVSPEMSSKCVCVCVSYCSTKKITDSLTKQMQF